MSKASSKKKQVGDLTSDTYERGRFSSWKAKFGRPKSVVGTGTSGPAAMEAAELRKKEQELIDAGELVICAAVKCIAVRRCVDVCARIKFAEEREYERLLKNTGERSEPASQKRTSEDTWSDC